MGPPVTSVARLWEVAMRVLRCGDLMPGCDTVITGKSSEEVLAKAEDHARKDHNMVLIPPSVLSQIEAAITEGEAPGRAR
jgi:predicted small metal-binding protein